MLKRGPNSILAAIGLDLASVLISAIVSSWLRLHLPLGIPIPHVEGLVVLIGEAFLLYPIVFLLLSLYDPDRTMSDIDEYQSLTAACLIAALAQSGIIYFSARYISRLYLVYFFSLQFVLALSWRLIDRRIRKNRLKKGQNLRKILLIGGGEAGMLAIQHLKDLAWANVQLCGYITDGEPIPSSEPSISCLGRLQDAEAVINKQAIDDVLIASPAESFSSVQQAVSLMMDKPCNVWLLQDYFNLIIYGSRIEDLGGVPMISLKDPTLTGYQRVVKRGFDIILGTVLQILALPLMGAIALAIRIDSPGPVVFLQQRVGENGRLFRMYKFRSMVANADEHLDEVVQKNGEGKLLHKSPGDPRITRVGRFLRRTSIDELPQFLNVLKGEMSLVGPRPELPILVENYEAWQRKRLAVPQGMTGWWQVNGRSDKPMHLNTEDDLYYVKNYSLLLDIQILLKTPWVVIRGKGAY